MFFPIALSVLTAPVLSLGLCGLLVRRIGIRGLVLIPPRSDRWHSAATPSMGIVAGGYRMQADRALSVGFVRSIRKHIWTRRCVRRTTARDAYESPLEY